MRHYGLLVVLAWVGCGLSSPAAQPAWWTDSATQIIDPASGISHDNYAPANLGQLKNIAAKAALYLNNTVPPLGAGDKINAMVAAFSTTAADNYVPINLGQLKAVAQPFYDRLHDPDIDLDTKASLQSQGEPTWAFDTPWDPSTPVSENYAPANLGQLKWAFSFDLLAATATALDQSLTVSEESSIPITLTSTCPYLTGITFTTASPAVGPAHGTLSGTPPNLVYAPFTHTYGSDSFTFQVTQGGHTSTGTISLNIAPVNHAPEVDFSVEGQDPTAGPKVFTFIADPDGTSTQTFKGAIYDIDDVGGMPNTLTATWSQDVIAEDLVSIASLMPPAVTCTTATSQASPFGPTLTLTFPQPGTYHLRLTGDDGVGPPRSQPAIINVIPNTHPTVPTISITGTTGVVLIGTPITLTATVSGTVTTGVTFYDGAQVIGTVASAPYTLGWAPTHLLGHYISAQVANGTAVAVSNPAFRVDVVSDLSTPVNYGEPSGNNGHPDDGGDGGSAAGADNTGNKAFGGPGGGNGGSTGGGGSGGSGGNGGSGGDSGDVSDPGGDDDSDGLSNADEARFGTDPSNPDTDNDGVVDGKDGWPGGTNKTEETKFSPPRLPDPQYIVVDVAKEDDRQNSPFLENTAPYYSGPQLSDSGDVIYGFLDSATIGPDDPDNPTGGAKTLPAAKLYCWKGGTATVIQDPANTGLSVAERTFFPKAINATDSLAGYSTQITDPYQVNTAVTSVTIPTKRTGSAFALTKMDMSFLQLPPDAYPPHQPLLPSGELTGISDDGYTIGSVIVRAESGLNAIDEVAGAQWAGNSGSTTGTAFYHYYTGAYDPLTESSYKTSGDAFIPSAIGSDAGHSLLGVKTEYDDTFGTPAPTSTETDFKGALSEKVSDGIDPGGIDQAGDDYAFNNSSEMDIWLNQGGSFTKAKVTNRQGSAVEVSSLNSNLQALSGNYLWQNYFWYNLDNIVTRLVTVNGKQVWQNFEYLGMNKSGMIIAIADKDENGDGTINLGIAPEYSGQDKRHIVLLIPVTIEIAPAEPQDGNEVFSPIAGSNGNVVIGQKIVLKCTTGQDLVSIDSYNWTIPDNNFKDLNLATDQSSQHIDPLTTAYKQNQVIRFYWIDGGQKTVKCAVSLYGQAADVEANINVKVPQVYVGSSRLGKSTIYAHTIGLYGQDPSDSATGNDGITFSAEVIDPVGFERGQFCFIQLVTTGRTRAFENGVHEHWKDNGQQGLDTSDPYGIMKFSGIDEGFQHEIDNPEEPLNIPYDGPTGSASSGGNGGLVNVTIANDNFVDYLMYLPIGNQSVLVPLGKETWHWGGVAALDGDGVWQPSGMTQKIDSPWAATTEYPSWNRKITIDGQWTQ